MSRKDNIINSSRKVKDKNSIPRHQITPVVTVKGKGEDYCLALVSCNVHPRSKSVLIIEVLHFSVIVIYRMYPSLVNSGCLYTEPRNHHLISSHLISSHLISSHLISPHLHMHYSHNFFWNFKLVSLRNNFLFIRSWSIIIIIFWLMYISALTYTYSNFVAYCCDCRHKN